MIANEGWFVVNEGSAAGTIVGGNLRTFSLLFGTKYIPSLKDKIVFLENAVEVKLYDFDRKLQSLIHQPDFDSVRGLIIGRFQPGSGMTNDLLLQLIKNKKELKSLPIIANVDFGHSDPKITWPIGGSAEVQAFNKSFIKITKH